MVVIREKKAIFKDEKDVLRNVRNLVTTNQFRHIPSVTEEERDDYLEKLVEDSRVEVIRDDLVEHYPDEVMRAFTSKASREKLTKLVQEEQRFGTDDEGQKKAAYVVNEIVGFEFIDRLLLHDESITDIGWNSTFLTVESADQLRIYKAEQLQLTDPEKTVFRIVKKFADAVGKPFTRNDPILDSVSGNLRLNAMHQVISPTGTTMSLRVSRPGLALTEETFVDFAPSFVLEFLKIIMKAGSMSVIGGETGSGKTELIKMMLSFVPKKDRIFMIEDVPETRIKELLPDHDIFSLVTGNIVTISDLVQAALRNYPKWIVPSETRGSEAYEMIQAARTNHSGLTSIHSTNCRAHPRRLVTMSSMGYKINEEAVTEDILTFFDFGFQIKTAYIEIDSENLIFKKIRYLSEIVEYSVKDTATTLFKQVLNNGQFYVTTGQLSDQYKEKLAERFLSFDFPEMTNEKINKSEELEQILQKAVAEFANQSTSDGS